MPATVHRGKDSKGSYYQYDDKTKYYYVVGDDKSRMEAKKLAMKSHERAMSKKGSKKTGSKKGSVKKGSRKTSTRKTGSRKGSMKAGSKKGSVKKGSVKKGSKSYKIHDNGGRPFEVVVHPTKIEVFKNDGKKIFTKSYKKIFLGGNERNKGNSIVIHTGPGKYTYIGSEIYSFMTKDGEEIKKYYSPIGNSDVPYPYAVGQNHTYFMLDKQTVPNELLNLKKDAYDQFYGNTIKDAQKKKFRTKMIQKRLS
jgi:hypothetical protein